MNPAFTSYPFTFVDRAARGAIGAATNEWNPDVAIVGGGIAGLTAALALARQGVRSTVLEADTSVCFGSRAICISRRSLEIFDRYGIAEQILARSLPWTGGRSYYRDHEVLRFTMPNDVNQKFPPMVNIQQYLLEEILVQALESCGEWVNLLWGCVVKSIIVQQDEVQLRVEGPRGAFDLNTAWLVACDGGRSLVRQSLGLPLLGTSYEGRYVIVDILMKSARETERLAWFDPVSNPGSTILMHKQPDDVWRIDYQLDDGVDADEAVKPERVLPLVASHLDMIGETASWSPIWISLYKANALSLERYRHGRILFAGDAAHLVPIFGVRGANSSIDDADNLAWKLAAVVREAAHPGLLETYSEERRQAAAENLASGMKSTEFMAPPTFAFRAMREAVLDLAIDHPEIRSLINPRQTSPIAYLSSGLNAKSSEDATFVAGPNAGEVLPSFPLERPQQGASGARIFTTDLARAGSFLLICFGSAPLNWHERPSGWSGFPLRVVTIHRDQGHVPVEANEDLVDPTGAVFAAFDASQGTTYLVRPDGHVLGRWRTCSLERVETAIAAVSQHTPATEVAA